jgi:hypothetical protein
MRLFQILFSLSILAWLTVLGIPSLIGYVAYSYYRTFDVYRVSCINSLGQVILADDVTKLELEGTTLSFVDKDNTQITIINTPCGVTRK